MRLNGLIFYPYLWLTFYFWRPNQISAILGFPSFLRVLGLANVILTLKHNFLIIPLMQFPFSFKPPTWKYLKNERAIRMSSNEGVLFLECSYFFTNFQLGCSCKLCSYKKKCVAQKAGLINSANITRNEIQKSKPSICN